MAGDSKPGERSWHGLAPKEKGRAGGRSRRPGGRGGVRTPGEVVGGGVMPAWQCGWVVDGC